MARDRISPDLPGDCGRFGGWAVETRSALSATSVLRLSGASATKEREVMGKMPVTSLLLVACVIGRSHPSPEVMAEVRVRIVVGERGE